MTLARTDISIDVTSALPSGATSEPVSIAATVVWDPDRLSPRPRVHVAIPGGTYHRRYWDLRPPGRAGYSQAEWTAGRGDVFVACDYLGGGDSSRPADGDFMTLEVCADAAHHVVRHLRDGIARGTLVGGLPALSGSPVVGLGQSLGGFITMMQEGKYRDFDAVAIFGASPLVIANIPQHRRLEGLSTEERRRAIMEDNARTAGVSELPVYHGAPRANFAGIFHVPDVAHDLLEYDEAECDTLISRVSGTDGMTPGISQALAAQITVPVFLAFGEIDVSADPHLEPSGYPAANDITLVVVPDMAHMHNFADTRALLWERFGGWLSAVVDGAGTLNATRS